MTAKGRSILITGGAGFIGTNLAHYLLTQGFHVRILDNLSRRGVEQNLAWLSAQFANLEFTSANIEDVRRVKNALRGVDHVFHFAAQVAVTNSLEQPELDFQTNLLGTFKLLETIRACAAPPSLIFTSTNKVYGRLALLKLKRDSRRYTVEDRSGDIAGISETQPLDFHSPYGCSKGAADQYVIDYARIFGLRNVVFRMSCIYGPHQFGTEDQGWVAHFLKQAQHGEPIIIYGDGYQVRDLLFVDDLINAFMLAWNGIERFSGQPFNIGGGISNTISLLELLDWIEGLNGRRPETVFVPSRPGDQPYYVSNTAKFEAATGWKPRVSVSDGLQRLSDWLENESLRVKPVSAANTLLSVNTSSGQ
jgi:CDP-paratose 2-epimerase